MDDEIQHSLLYLSPYKDESISHYLGRWFRLEVVQSDAISLGRKLRLGKTPWRWQNFYFNPGPTHEELEKLGKLMGLEVDDLLLMFPPQQEPIKPRPIRLCAACYVEVPCHLMKWQFQSTEGCDLHRLRLLSKCPGCEEPFPIPTKWESGRCQRCGMPFKTMVKRQKAY